jgi:hypothetical protein
LGKTTQAYPTLARGEVPIMLILRLFLPESWTSDAARLKHADTESGNVSGFQIHVGWKTNISPSELSATICAF